MTKKMMVLVGIVMLGLLILIRVELKLVKEKTVCKFYGEEYAKDEAFLIRLESGCSLCYCDEVGVANCELTHCPGEAPE